MDVVGPVAPQPREHLLGHLHDRGIGLGAVHHALRAARCARGVEHRPRGRPLVGDRPVGRRLRSRAGRRRRTRAPGRTARRPPPRPGCAGPRRSPGPRRRSRRGSTPTSSGRRCQLSVTTRHGQLGGGGHRLLERDAVGEHDRQPVTGFDAHPGERVGQARRPLVELPVGQGAVARDQRTLLGRSARFAGKPFTVVATPIAGTLTSCSQT